MMAMVVVLRPQMWTDRRSQEEWVRIFEGSTGGIGLLIKKWTCIKKKQKKRR